MPDRAPLPLEFVFELRVEVSPAVELGPGPFGVRRMVPITGGSFAGPAISGRVLAGGADRQFVESDGLTILHAQYVIETHDGVRIEVNNPGVRHGPPEVMARLAAGEAVSPAEYYFRTCPRFCPPAGRYEWLRRSVFIGVGERYKDLVVVGVWKV